MEEEASISITKRLKVLLGNNPSLAKEYHSIRRKVGRIYISQYDISDTCNLSCEGCLYFAGSDRDNAPIRPDLDKTEAFFRNERDRGVNYAHLAGAEPSLALDTLDIASRYIPQGVVYTNGSKKIPDSIRFRIHVSLWGGREHSARIRGGDVIERALNNYRNDSRAVFVMAITPSNIDDIHAVAKLCDQQNVKLTFNHFSPTVNYLDKFERESKNEIFFRFAHSGGMDFTAGKLEQSHDEVRRAMVDFPHTVIYQADFNKYIHDPAGLYPIEDAAGIARSCGNRITASRRHFRFGFVDSGEVKCCAPNVNCSTCRLYANSLSTVLHRMGEYLATPEDFSSWLGIWQLWCTLFLDGWVPIEEDVSEVGF